MSVVTIFGLQRSGTNFAEQLVKRNIKGITIANTWSKPLGIWKHSYDIDNSSGTRNQRAGNSAGNRIDVAKFHKIGTEITSWYIHKNPYSWIESICTKNVDIRRHYPWVVHGDMKKHNVGNDNDQQTKFELKGLNVSALAKLYAEHTAWWYNLCQHRKIFHLSYEDLIRSIKHTEIGLKAFAEFNKFELVNQDKIDIPDKVGQSDKFNEESRNKYKRVQLSLLNWDQVVKINNILNHEHTHWQGYEIIGTQEKFNNHKV